MLSNGGIMIIAFLFLLNFTGNQPTLVAKHLTKLFDSMAKIKMQDATRFHRPFFYIAAIFPLSSMKAVAMTAKDGEEVEFFKACLCEGQVWAYLASECLQLHFEG